MTLTTTRQRICDPSIVLLLNHLELPAARTLLPSKVKPDPPYQTGSPWETMSSMQTTSSKVQTNHGSSI
ncbi:hypothetical protein HanRHA438_Chr13g0623451 [Helianthus annuus]|nr:hypothetical protein HanRHA438_Chr13g0623451 [Helianthus annuus]